MSDSKYQLVRNARVSVKQVTEEGNNGQRHKVAEIDVFGPNGAHYNHRFPRSSRVSKHLDIMTAGDLQARLTDGNFFFIDDQLVDFRDGHYHGFIHDDGSIAKFMEVLGFDYRNNLPLHRNRRRRGNEAESNIVLRKLWSKNEILIPQYKGGADFNTQLSFTWNPFTGTIRGAFDLIRQICSNGMVGITPLLNPRIPLINRWEQHLDISSIQIQNKITDMVTRRVGEMNIERATLADCMLLRRHAFERLHDRQAGMTEEDRMRLMNLMAAVEPNVHLAHIYKQEVFDDTTVAAQLPSHLSLYDVYNIATELRSHSNPTRQSSSFALDKFANNAMFGEGDNYTAAAGQIGHVKPAAFSSPEVAFFGLLNADGKPI